MRRADRQVTSTQAKLAVLSACDCCRLGLRDGEEIYVVPINFGYRFENGSLELFFHGAAEGRKAQLIELTHRAGFEMDTKHELVTGQNACAYSFRYQSIIGSGEISVVSERSEKLAALECIMEHYGSGPWAFDENALEKVCVWKLTVGEWSCKEH